ncbi:MAG TPA: antibiotic biosynthesis monooxygenase [Pseudomonadales bacterium]|nr:antibiotic biosynthesis monooxygenase [Pseudomonadales bacterium]HNB82993.1 antibiotic biosynthesis monooxygenase [Pseudomonadales bacterium]HNC75898.1 antibiotic biosynthesis monooxygenase [Pseudomonadales bacterium]HNF07744.1 antibiotic biosynthesis monooxygenase [Pseudomonadales bacterium]HNL23160.1 antibiotic biosynthesis monooxygenase [Pseudomonadales bacterium]
MGNPQAPGATMYVVLFRAKIRALDDDYLQTAARMRELALQQFGCLEFQSMTQGEEEVAISWWPSEAAILAWKQHPEHLLAQRAGRERWYCAYSVQVAAVVRDYQVVC